MNLRHWIITIAACLSVALALAAVKALQIKGAIEFAEAMPEQSETVEAVTVSTQRYIETASVLGEIVAPRRVDLSNELAGRVIAVNFESGSEVSEGQLLLQLDVREETAQLESAKARADLARSVFRRTANLRESDVVSEDREDEVRATLRVVEAEIEALKSIIDKKTLRAPFAGRTGIHQFEVGQYLQANSPVTTLIGETDFLWVDFNLPQFNSGVGVGDEVRVRIMSDAVADPEQLTRTGVIIARNSVVSSAARSMQYRAMLPIDADRRLTAQTAVEVLVPVAKPVTQPVVPTQSILHGSGEQYVYVLTPEPGSDSYRANRRPIQPGNRVDDRHVLVASGLQEGERIAAAGAFKLREGLLVHTREREPQESASGADD